jgi:hypothetical protein
MEPREDDTTVAERDGGDPPGEKDLSDYAFEYDEPTDEYTTETDDRDDGPSVLPTGDLIRLPDGYVTYPGYKSTYEMVCRRIVSDTAVSGKQRRPHVESFSEKMRWLIAVARWTARFGAYVRRRTATTEISREWVKVLTSVTRCTPTGYRQRPGFRTSRCGRTSFCLYCYARSAATACDRMIAAYYARPDRSSGAALVRIPGPKEVPVAYRSVAGDRHARRLDPVAALKRAGCHGGVCCRLPIGYGSRSVVLGVRFGDARSHHERAVPAVLGAHYFVDYVIKELAYPVRWVTLHGIARRANPMIEADLLGDRNFDTYGACRSAYTRRT